jgi:hypothetical protein
MSFAPDSPFSMSAAVCLLFIIVPKMNKSLVRYIYGEKKKKTEKNNIPEAQTTCAVSFRPHSVVHRIPVVRSCCCCRGRVGGKQE